MKSMFKAALAGAGLFALAACGGDADDRAADNVEANAEAMADNIEDQADNTTRFLVLGKEPVGPTGDDVTSLVFGTPNKAGALCEVLQAFARAGISMSRIQSRPLRRGTWEYLFFVDIGGHQTDPAVSAALAELGRHTSVCRVLGSYPRAVI